MLSNTIKACPKKWDIKGRMQSDNTITTTDFFNFDFQSYKKSQRISVPKWPGKKIIFQITLFLLMNLNFSILTDNFSSLWLTFQLIDNV
jgi:hypothetical protein